MARLSAIMWLNGELEGFSLSHRPLWLGCSFLEPITTAIHSQGSHSSSEGAYGLAGGGGGTAILGHTPSDARCPGEKGRALLRLWHPWSSLQGQDVSLHPCSLRAWLKNIFSSLWRGVGHLQNREAEPPSAPFSRVGLEGTLGPQAP